MRSLQEKKAIQRAQNDDERERANTPKTIALPDGIVTSFSWNPLAFRPACTLSKSALSLLAFIVPSSIVRVFLYFYNVYCLVSSVKDFFYSCGK